MKLTQAATLTLAAKLTRAANDLTLQEQLGECFMPRIRTDDFFSDAAYRKKITNWVVEHRVGGFCIFGGTLETTVLLVSELQQIALSGHQTPLLFSSDCEFGLPMRLRSGGTEFPDAMAVARSGPNMVERVSRAIGLEMKELGIGWNFAPVADINSNPQNPIINTRAFGDEPTVVAQCVAAAIKGTQSAGVLSAAKHFPGHGDTNIDSHLDLPVIHRGLPSFEALEFIPFRAAIARNVESVMLGHIAVPELALGFGATSNEAALPASLSKPIIQSILRKHLGFDGVIITDALEMHAITDRYGDADACRISFEAGADIMLLPEDPDSAYNLISEQSRTSSFLQFRIQESSRRIADLKKKSNVQTSPEVKGNFSFPEHEALAEEIAQKALEPHGDVELAGTECVLCLCDNRGLAMEHARRFKDGLKSLGFKNIVVMSTDEHVPTIPTGQKTILATFHRARGYVDSTKNGVSFDQKFKEVEQALIQNHSSVSLLIQFGSPYIDALMSSSPKAVLKTYSESIASVVSVIDFLESNLGK